MLDHFTEKELHYLAFLDFQLFDHDALHDADRFFQQFSAWLTDTLELPDKVAEYWNNALGNSQRCTRYVGRYILKELGEPLVLAMDEVETIFDTPFRSDFFAMLRGWHNNRANQPIWKKLDLALVTSTEPYQLIQNLNQSPFNVGEILDIDDFQLTHVQELNTRHGNPFNQSQLEHLFQLLNGHPYLTRKALYYVTSQRISVNDLFSTTLDDRGAFGDHLRYHLFRLYGHDDLIEAFQQVLRSQQCTDDHLFFRLRGAGLIRREGRNVVPRCQLYADYFKERLHK